MVDGSSLFDEIYKNPMRNLNNVVRYSGVFCMKIETDGFHVIDMMAMCMKISDMIEEDLKEERYKIDRKDLIYRCYLHDMDECLTGDITRNIKYYNDDIYKSISSVANELISKNFSEEISKDISSSKDKDTVNGLIVKLADTLQSSMKIYEECRLGNFHFKKIIEDNLQFVVNLKDVVRSSKLNKKIGRSVTNTLLNIIDSFEFKLADEISNNIKTTKYY